MAEVQISPQAHADMREISDYLSRELHNPGAALQLIRRFQKAASRLRDFPEMGTPLPHEGMRVPYRYLTCGNYLLFYHTINGIVHVDRVLYGRRDYLALLFGAPIDEE